METSTDAHGCDLSRLPTELASAFIPLEQHPLTQRWMDTALAHPHGVLASVAARIGRTFLSDYDVNGLLGLHDMHLLPTPQWSRLLGPSQGGRLLDVGAGDGTVTRTLAPLFDEVVTTELSPPMARRLRRLGLACHEVDLTQASAPGGPYDGVALLNVLDRTLLPTSLLSSARAQVRAGGFLLLSMPLPYAPHVHRGAATVDPEELLPIVAEDWEGAASELWRKVLEPLGLELGALARAPYLSRGDSRAPLYRLDCAIFRCTAP